MSSMQAFNFADFYRNNGGALEYVATVPVSAFVLTCDIVSARNSKITCKAVDIANGDYGILKNSLGRQIVFKVLNKETDETDSMDLTVATWVDVCEISTAIDTAEAGTVLLFDLAGEIQANVDELETNANILLPYSGTPDVITYLYKYIDPAKLYGFPELLKDAIATGNYYVKVRYKDGKIDFQVLPQDDNAIYKLNLRDVNIISEFKLGLSDMEYNIIKAYVTDQNWAEWYYRVKQDGTVEQLVNIATGESATISEDGSYGATSDWGTGCITKERIGTIIEKGDADIAAARLEVGKKVYSQLREQYYNHEITVVANLDNDKMDLSDLDKLFSKTVWLYLDGQEIRTKITRYDYSGGNTIELKFGNARMALTDKLKKKGVI